MKLRLGTRGSALARAQSGDVARMLTARGHEVEVVIIQTLGDVQQDRPFAEVGAAGIFVREIERALLDERIDLAVHSYKDLPTQGPEPLVIAAVPERVDSADRLLIRREAVDEARGLLPVAEGRLIGTASARRQALVAELRPDLRTAMLRGNVPTRVRRLVDGDFDAILLAAAGLDRLRRSGDLPGEDALVEVRLDPSRFVPAPSQGALAVQVRREDAATVAAVAALHDARAAALVAAERALQARVEAGCQIPFGAWAREAPGGMELFATVQAAQGMAFAHVTGADPQAMAAEALAQLKAGGALLGQGR